MTIRERSLSAFTTSRVLVRLVGSAAGGDAYVVSSLLLPSGAPTCTEEIYVSHLHHVESTVSLPALPPGIMGMQS